MLGNLHKIATNIWIECRLSNNRDIVNINVFHEHLGLQLYKALPGFHAFADCNCIFWKGKQRSFVSKEFQKAFVSLGDTSIDSDETFSKIELLVCNMYVFVRKWSLSVVTELVCNVPIKLQSKKYGGSFLKKRFWKWTSPANKNSSLYFALIEQVKKE